MTAEPDEEAGKGVAGGAAAAMAAAAAAMAGAQAKAKEAQASTEAAEPGVPEQPGEGAAGGAAAVAKRDAPSARFFIRGVGKLGEHHLQDYFMKFGEVTEATLVRDKKTQRPRGMAFVTVAVRGDVAHSDFIDKITGETHTVNDQVLEIQEALPNPDKGKPKEAGGDGADAPAAAAGQAAAAAGPAEAEPAAAVEDPAAQATAQAQWEMHYLAMAINTSVPEVKSTTASFAKSGPPVRPGGGAGGKGKSKGHSPY